MVSPDSTRGDSAILERFAAGQMPDFVPYVLGMFMIPLDALRLADTRLKRDKVAGYLGLATFVLRNVRALKAIADALSLPMIPLDFSSGSKAKNEVSPTADIEAPDEMGVRKLTFAAYQGHLDEVRDLLSKGADVNIRNNQGYTALMIASENGHLDVAKELLAHGANVNARDAGGSRGG